MRKDKKWDEYKELKFELEIFVVNMWPRKLEYD